MISADFGLWRQSLDAQSTSWPWMGVQGTGSRVPDYRSLIKGGGRRAELGTGWLHIKTMLMSKKFTVSRNCILLGWVVSPGQPQGSEHHKIQKIQITINTHTVLVSQGLRPFTLCLCAPLLASGPPFHSTPGVPPHSSPPPAQAARAFHILLQVLGVLLLFSTWQTHLEPSENLLEFPESLWDRHMFSWYLLFSFVYISIAFAPNNL